jgi:hypothetical protein
MPTDVLARRPVASSISRSRDLLRVYLREPSASVTTTSIGLAVTEVDIPVGSRDHGRTELFDV